MMKTDIQIAQEAELMHIKDVAASIGISEEELEFYGKYKAKLSDELWENVKDRKDGKLVLVTAINPTPAGEGKTTITVGLGEAFAKMNKKAIIALREPSLGPCFGIKGGAAGGGYAQVLPMEDLNLHFTGDFHAITSANNLLAAMLDNHIQQGNALGIDPRNIVWKRCVDMNDRVLRNIVVGLGNKMDGMVREDHFVITVASEIMAILCLADDLADLKRRLGRIIVAYTFEGNPVTADDLQATGAMTALLKDAIKPNMIQTLEHTPALVHGGPFANIAHGCNSVRATKLALKISDITITEAGFGADLGAEKFMDIKCRKAGLKPDAVVLVATVEGLVAHHPAQPGAELARFHLPGVLPQGQEGVGHHLLRVPGAAPQNRARQAAGKAHVPVHQLLQGGGVPPPQAAQQLPLLQPYHLPAPVSSALSLILTQKPPPRFHRLSKNLSRRKASQSSCGRSRRNQMKIRHFRGHAPRK